MAIKEITIPAPQSGTDNTSGSPPSTAARAFSRFRGWLNLYSIDLLRISLGVVFLVFGALKFIPDASPAQELAVRAVETLTFGIIAGPAALLLIAVTETIIGVTLITGRFLRTGLAVLAVSLVGIMSPLVLFFDELVPGAPTLAAQYVFKDIVLAAAGLVVAAKALGATLVSAR